MPDEATVLNEQQKAMMGALTSVFPGIRQVAAEQVTGVVSKELVNNAIWSVAMGCIFILLWVRIRYFDFKWAGSAVVALVHDVLVLIGVFAMTQREINSPFVAAALTVVGFSVHDTIVIYDRIRENLRLRKGATFAETTNISLLETMARSVNTVLTVELVLIAVYLFGGASLRDFTFAMVVGVTTGAYSSIFNASQLVVVLKNREERRLARGRAVTGRPPRLSAAVAVPKGGLATREPVRALPQSAAPQARPVLAPQATLAVGQEHAPAQRAPIGEGPAPAPDPAGAGEARAARKKLKVGRKRKRRF